MLYGQEEPLGQVEQDSRVDLEVAYDRVVVVGLAGDSGVAGGSM